MGQLNQYNLGKMGVNVDKTEVHLEDGELRKAQNTIRNPLGHEGGIEKRPGLTPFNASAAAGAVKGGIGVPLTLLANSVGGTSLAGVTKNIYVGRATAGANMGASLGWWKSADRFVTAATLIGTGATPEAPRSSQLSVFGTGALSPLSGSPGCAVVHQNRMFYASNDYTRNVGRPLIRVFDGTVDQEFVRIPTNPLYGETQCQGVLSMMLIDGTIYLTVYDNDGVSTAGSGRVFSLDPSTGALLPLGTNAFADQFVPYALAWHMGRLWVGTFFRQGTGSAGTIHYIRPGIDATWTLDRTMSQGRGCSMLASFQGQLLAGGAGTATTVVEIRSAVGAWTVSNSQAINALTMGGIEYGGNFYCNQWQNSGAISTIRKFTGSAWSTVATYATPLGCSFTDGVLLYFTGGGDTFSQGIVSSPDGTTWTDKTAQLSSAAGLHSVGIVTP